VHRAKLFEGDDVVVKVQRPGIVTQAKADLGIIHEVAVMLAKRTDWAESYNLVGLVDESSRSVLAELNYENESFNARMLARNLAGIDAVHVPMMYQHLSTPKVLTMEFVRGVKITDTAALDATDLDRSTLAHTLIHAARSRTIREASRHLDSIRRWQSAHCASRLEG